MQKRKLCGDEKKKVRFRNGEDLIIFRNGAKACQSTKLVNVTIHHAP